MRRKRVRQVLKKQEREEEKQEEMSERRRWIRRETKGGGTEPGPGPKPGPESESGLEWSPDYFTGTVYQFLLDLSEGQHFIFRLLKLSFTFEHVVWSVASPAFSTRDTDTRARDKTKGGRFTGSDLCQHILRN